MTGRASQLECPHPTWEYGSYGNNLYKTCPDCGRQLTVGEVHVMVEKLLSLPESQHEAFMEALLARFPNCGIRKALRDAQEEIADPASLNTAKRNMLAIKEVLDAP